MKKILIFASFLALASPIFTQQVNPNTQIGWPTNCSTPGYVYSYQAKLCIPGGGGGGGIFTTVLPSGDATGATDGAAIQSACAATGLVQLTAGTYYVGHSNSTISVTAPCTIDGASVAATTIQNEGTTNWMFTAAFSETDPSNNYLPGLMVTNLSVHQDSSVTPTGGGAFNLSASGDAFNSSMFEHLYIGGDGLFSGFYIGPQMGAVSISDTFIWIAPTGPSAGQGCMEYNNPAPGGDNNLGFLCAVGAGTINYAFGGLTIDQSDTTTFDGIKIWNAPVLFTGAGNTHAVRFVNPSVEGGFRSPNGYAFDFGTGTAPNGVQIVGGETAGFLAAFNHLSNVSSLAYCWDDENVSGSPNQICSGWLLPLSQLSNGGTGAATAAAAVSNLLSNPAIGEYILNCTSTSACAPVAFSGGGGNIPADAHFVFTGTSWTDDDAETQAPTIALTGWSQSGSTVTVTNSGTNGFHAGDWVNMRFATGWTTAYLPSGIAIKTGYTLFQVLATGLSSTQFEFTAGFSVTTCSASCGTTESAMNNLPFTVTQQPGMPSAAVSNTVVVLPSNVTIVGEAAAYSTAIHPYSPAVTGHPAYLTISDPWNDLGVCSTVAAIESAYTSLIEAAHTDGFKIVIPSIPAKNISQQYGAGFCSFPVPPYTEMVTLDRWLRTSLSPTIANRATEAYWDYFVDLGHSYNDAYNAALVYGSSSAWQLWGNAEAAALVSGSGTPLASMPLYFGAPYGTGNSAANGYNWSPSSDSIYTYSWNEASSYQGYPNYQIMGLGTEAGYEGLTLNGWMKINEPSYTGGNPVLLTITSSNNLIPTAAFLNPSAASGTSNLGWLDFGHDSTTYNAAQLLFNYVSSGSTSNTASMNLRGTTGIKVDGAGNLYVPAIATSASTAPICPNGTGGAFTTSGCVTGSTFSVNGSAVSGPNLNATTPSADSGYTVATPKVSGANVIVETPNYTGISPIVVTGQAISCPTCGTSSGGTNVSLNSGAAETNLPITGFMPQLCADTSGSGTAQSCSTANTFTPQAGNCITYMTTTSPSGAVTLNVNSLGAKTVRIWQGGSIYAVSGAPYNYPSGAPMAACYDGTYWNIGAANASTVVQTNGGPVQISNQTGVLPYLCADTSTSGTAQSCTTTPGFTPQTGNCVVYSTTTANSGTGLTVNINSLGAKSVAVAGSSGWTTTLVTSSSIPSNKPMHLCYDGTNWNASGTGYQQATATTQSACDNSTNLATTAYAGSTCNLVKTSGSPLSATAQGQTIWNNTSSAYVVDLPTPTASGPQICIGNYKAQAQAVSFVPGSGVTIYYKGVAGTTSSSTGLVSGGAAGDFICVEGTDSTTYTAIGAGYGTWTNN